MKDIAIYGAGGLGREVACLIRLINEVEEQWNLIGFFDDGLLQGDKNEYGVVLGGIDELNSYNRPLCLAIAVGSPCVVKNIYDRIKLINVDFPNLIAPNLTLLDKKNFHMGYGNIISVGCSISCNVHLGNFNLLNSRINIGHDTLIGDFNSFMPAVLISGEVVIGECNFFGVASVVLQGLKIGNNTTIGANSLIIRKTKNDMTYVGSPAIIVKY